MRIYKVYRTDDWGYDDFSDFVCIAKSKQKAKLIHPSKTHTHSHVVPCISEYCYCGWVKSLGYLKVEYIGRASINQKENTVICSSYHAG